MPGTTGSTSPTSRSGAGPPSRSIPWRCRGPHPFCPLGAKVPALLRLLGLGRPEELVGVVSLPGAGARHHLQRHGSPDPAVCGARWHRPTGMAQLRRRWPCQPRPSCHHGHGLSPAVPWQVCGVVFFSSDAAEQLLATHVVPPLDACTYMGLDSGAPPIQVTATLRGTGPLAPWVPLLGISCRACLPLCCQIWAGEVAGGEHPAAGLGTGWLHRPARLHLTGPLSLQLSLFFDIVLCMAGGMTEEDFVKGGGDAIVRSARSVLWTALRAFPLSMGERCCGGCMRHDPSLSLLPLLGERWGGQGLAPGCFSPQLRVPRSSLPTPLTGDVQPGCPWLTRVSGTATFAVSVPTALLPPCSVHPRCILRLHDHLCERPHLQPDAPAWLCQPLPLLQNSPFPCGCTSFHPQPCSRTVFWGGRSGPRGRTLVPRASVPPAAALAPGGRLFGHQLPAGRSRAAGGRQCHPALSPPGTWPGGTPP